MEYKSITARQKDTYNSVVSHPLQSFEWGEFREKTGIKVIRNGFFNKEKIISGFTMTIHKIPYSPYNIGYLPKGDMPTPELIDELKKIGKKEKCIFIQLEPNVITSYNNQDANAINILNIENLNLVPAAHPLFTKYTFVLDLTKSEEELLKNMHPKARYNFKIAQKHGVEIVEDNSDESFNEYWKLTEETTRRQGFFAHTKRYHELQWNILGIKNKELRIKNDTLTSHLMLAKYKEKILAAWILFVFKDTLYYPYGSSSNENREVMASNLIMWEAIKFGKRLGLKKFDMWGALGTNPDPKDPWFGFHDFKRKYSPEPVEFIGSYDLVIDPILYQGYKLADKARWFLMRLKK